MHQSYLIVISLLTLAIFILDFLFTKTFAKYKFKLLITLLFSYSIFFFLILAGISMKAWDYSGEMNFNNLIYLIFFLPLLVFALWISREKVLKEKSVYLKYALGMVLLLIIWGELALVLKQWYFPKETNLGIYFGSHPVELIIQAIIIPLFVISIWEFIKRRN